MLETEEATLSVTDLPLATMGSENGPVGFRGTAGAA